MDRRRPLALLVAAAALVVLATLADPGALASVLRSDGPYPEGAGPDHVDFSTLEGDVAEDPRDHWESYVVGYAEPPDRPLVEGVYYVDAETGAIVAERWDDAREYVNGSTYAFVQPAESVPHEHRREELEADDAFVYHEPTDAYYRYDPDYGWVAPTNVGRHTDVLEPYAWEAVGRTSHHGVPVVTYRATGRLDGESGAPRVENGTLQLGVEDGVVYAYDVELEADGGTRRYAYEVRPAPFPEHDWVDTAREVADAGSG